MILSRLQYTKSRINLFVFVIMKLSHLEIRGFDISRYNENDNVKIMNIVVN